MQLIRQFELMAEEKYKMEGKIRGFFHAYVGQEAIAAGCITRRPFYYRLQRSWIGHSKRCKCKQLYGRTVW